MFTLYGFFTQNSRKPLYVLEAIGADFEFVYTDLVKGEHKRDEFLAMTPVGKVPVLDHGGRYLFESGAICRYVANVTDSPLYPVDRYQRAQVDQWMDYFTVHAGQSITTIYFQTVMKARAGMGDPNEKKVAEATRFLDHQFAIVDRHLANATWLANNTLSIADFFAYAYVEQERDIEYSIDEFENLSNWYRLMADNDAIRRAVKRLPG